ncbi:MAG TPA: alpha/beta hydrolase [Pyrinomonadaceae bacterium]|jgi:pimeloyl-ACP methyl ester carboxylesterase
MRTQKVIGGNGVGLNVVETGNAGGQAILFIHGFSQSHLVWKRQLDSDLAGDFRLVAMDIRGHGRSDKPHQIEAYTDSKLWADDINAVIGQLKLDRPILCGWSYGPLNICDYIRHYGESQIGGLHFVGGITKIGTEEATAFLTPDILGLVPGFFSTETAATVDSLRSLIRLFFVDAPSDEDAYQLLGASVSVEPLVRQALFSRTVDNDDILADLKAPLLISHSIDDRIVLPTAAEQIRSVVPHAVLHQPSGVGHGLFMEDAAGFNTRLRKLANAVSTGEARHLSAAIASN